MKEKYPKLSTFLYGSKLSTFLYGSRPHVSIKNSYTLVSEDRGTLKDCLGNLTANIWDPNTEEPEYKEHDTWESFIKELKRLEETMKGEQPTFTDIQLGDFRLWYILRENELKSSTSISDKEQKT